MKFWKGVREKNSARFHRKRYHSYIKIITRNNIRDIGLYDAITSIYDEMVLKFCINSSTPLQNLM